MRAFFYGLRMPVLVYGALTQNGSSHGLIYHSVRKYIDRFELILIYKRYLHFGAEGCMNSRIFGAPDAT